MMDRRSFLACSAAATTWTSPLFAATEWGVPVLDIHLHPRTDAPESAHLEGSGTDRAVLLPGGSPSGEERAKSVSAGDPKHFVRFTRIDATAPDAVATLRKSLQGGAIGVGEMKLPVDVDGPEMRRVYSVAAEFGVPVLLHFEEGNFNTGIRRMPALLQAFPKTVFIGHGQTWWANVSSEPGDEKGYPPGPVKSPGLTDRLLADYPNMFGDLSANSGRNAMARDPEFTPKFLARHKAKLMFGSDCPCKDGRGTGTNNSKCIARETLAILKRSASVDLFRQIAWDNAVRLLKLPA